MNNETKTRIFIRACVQFTATGLLKMSAEDCINLLQEVFIVADFLEDKSTMMLACNEIGLLFEEVEPDYSEALQYQQLHLTLAVETEDEAAQVEAYSNLGKIYFLLNKHKEALSCYEKSKDIAIENGNKEAECQCYGKIGLVYFNLGHHDNAIKLLKQYLIVAMQINNKMHQKIAYITMGSVYKEMEDIPHVINCYEEWLKINPKDDDQQRGAVYSILGDAYIRVASYQQALKCFENFLEISKRLRDVKMEQDAYELLGYFYSKQEACFVKAVDYFKKELELAIKRKDQKTVATAYGELGKLYNKYGHHGDAIKSFKQYLAVAIEINDSMHQKTAYINMADVYTEMKDFPQVIICYEEWLKNATKAEKDREGTVYSNLGDAYSKVGNEQQALKCFETSLKISKELKDQAMEQNAHECLGCFYSKQETNMTKAVDHFAKSLELANKLNDKKGLTTLYGNLGKLYINYGNHGDALKSFKQCLDAAIETNDTMHQKTAYINMADVYTEMKDFSQVIICYEDWLKILTKDEQLEKGQVLNRLGIAVQALDNYQEARECHEKSLEIAQSLQDQKLEEQAYKCLANLYAAQSSFQKAIDNYKKYLKLAVSLNNKSNEAEAYQRLGQMYAQVSDYDMAVDYSEKAIEAAANLDDKSVEAIANSTFGIVYLSKGDYERGMQYSKRSLEISTNIGFKQGQAQAYNNFGSGHHSMGNYYEAIKYKTKALELWADVGHKIGIATTHVGLGGMFEYLGQYNEAIEHYKKSEDISRKIEDKCGEGRALCGLGNCFIKMQKLEDAVHHYEKSLDIALEVNDKSSQLSVYLNLVKCKTFLGQYPEAMEMVDKQICLAEEMGDKNLKSSGYNTKGEVFLRLHDSQQAIDCFEKALKISQEIGNKTVESNSYRNLGTAYWSLSIPLNEKKDEQKGASDREKEGKEKREEYVANTIYYFKQTLQCKEWLFDHLKKEDSLKISLLETFISDYKTLTNVLMLQNENKDALLVSERGRARALDDVLTSKYNLSQESQSSGDPISYADMESLANDCSILFYSLLGNSLSAWAIDAVKSSSFRLNVPKLSNNVDSAYNTLKIREIKCEDRLIKKADEPEENQNLSVHTLDAAEELLLSLYEKTDQERCIWEIDLQDTDSPHPLEGLYKALISPLYHLLTKDEIVIIPDGVLFTLPFAALRDPNSGKYLSETKRIRVAPSLTSLKTLQECPADFHSKTGALIIGNPKVGKVVFKGTIKEINDLPCAEQEAKEISQLLGVKPYIGSQATKENIKQNLREGVAVIHFAAHGTTDGEIFLAPSTTHDLPSEEERSEEERSEEDRSKEGSNEEVPSEEDYILTMKEVQESGVRPQLVVLSCCHSGRGEIKADGVVGMSRAFLAAGARAVVASLWAIADEATMVFMEKFYTHLKHGESASQSLQAAMKDMREIPMYNDEQYWGPFFLIGDDVTIKF